MEWNKFEDCAPPLNQYILIRNENSKNNNICPAVSSYAGSFVFISCAGCRWSIPSEPYTHWALYPNEGLICCEGCGRNYIYHLCDPNFNQHSRCVSKNRLTPYEQKELELKNHELVIVQERNENIRWWLKRIIIGVAIWFIIEKITLFVVPLIKTELEFRYKKKYIKMYKDELKEEIKEISKFAIDSTKDIIRELKK
jgi:hypothetical protein